ncbi:MAG: sugar ABC transporter permease [Oscillospiraceae bacterium]|nr:sugar ABC transporter permease [Oscillospiraceae bacterium]
MSTNALTKAAERKRIKDPSLLAALKNGGPLVWISCLVMGFANIASGQIIMGLIYLAIEAGVFFYLFAEMGGLHWLSLLPSLGDRVQEEVYDEAQGMYVYVAGDDSNQILLYGVATLCIIALLIFVWQLSVRSGYKSVMMKKAGCQTNFIEQVKTLFDENIHKLLMILPLAGIAVFTILPLLYMMCMAFTNYNTQNPVLFDWVGLENFKSVFIAYNAIG